MSSIEKNNNAKEWLFWSLQQELSSLKTDIQGRLREVLDASNPFPWIKKNLNDLSMSILWVNIINDSEKSNEWDESDEWNAETDNETNKKNSNETTTEERSKGTNKKSSSDTTARKKEKNEDEDTEKNTKKDLTDKNNDATIKKLTPDKSEKNKEQPDKPISVEKVDAAESLMYYDHIDQNPKEFWAKVLDISDKIWIDPNWLMWVMYKESSLDHTAENHIWSVWLIQFTRDKKWENFKIIDWKKYYFSDIKNMSNVDQLDLVYKYYKSYKHKINSYEDLYLATFYPVAMGKPDGFILGSERNPEWAQKIGKQNKGINNWNPISVADVKQWIRQGVPPQYANHFSDWSIYWQAA